MILQSSQNAPVIIGIYTAQDIRVTDRASSFTNTVISIRTINMDGHGH
nr:hypothetical protein [uncultured Mogibacterium sp.]